jgi:alpha-D-ribose 1-methylphosphonate 5-triphosphate diphosphatase
VSLPKTANGKRICMMPLTVTFTGAEILWPEGLGPGSLSLHKGRIVKDSMGPSIDLTGARILPGIIDLHGDGFEHHVAPRRGALLAGASGIVTTEAELAANGITTAYLAQFFSWEGGMRGPDFAETVFANLDQLRHSFGTDIRVQLRLETHLLDAFDRALAAIDRYGIEYLVFNDHLQHDRLAEGRRPKRLTGQALKSGRNPQDHLDYMISLHLRRAEVPAAIADLAGKLIKRGVRLGSHDDNSPSQRASWAGQGATISEFPETIDAAEAAIQTGSAVVMGAPNIVRGASHSGNVSARDLVAAGLCDALASDYHYPSPRAAAQVLQNEGICDFADAWHLISAGPAKIMGLVDRGQLSFGHRADLIIEHQETHRIAATIAGGQVTYLNGELGARLITGANH